MQKSCLFVRGWGTQTVAVYFPSCWICCQTPRTSAPPTICGSGIPLCVFLLALLNLDGCRSSLPPPEVEQRSATAPSFHSASKRWLFRPSWLFVWSACSSTLHRSGVGPAAGQPPDGGAGGRARHPVGNSTVGAIWRVGQQVVGRRKRTPQNSCRQWRAHARFIHSDGTLQRPT